MPTLQRFGAIVVRMYADDHAPPHFHVEAPDFEVLVRISDLTIYAGEARPAQIAEFCAGPIGSAAPWRCNGPN